MNNVLDESSGSGWSIYNGDCVQFARDLPDNCIDIAVYSPPFSSLYVYSESVADMGNVASDDEFFESYAFLLKEMHRITRPGRVSCVHVKDLVYYQNASDDGSAGLRAFSDACTAAHIEAGFTFHCRVTIYRDPVLERAKTNAHGLLWKTFQSDSSFCRVGMPEYLMIYRKWARPGEEEFVVPVTHPKDKVPLTRWQQLASPVWNLKESGQGDGDLPSTDVLNVKAARDENAEKHLCPMPLNITRRALELYSNKGEVLFSPFAGVGSEGVAALREGRKFIGTELHPAYYRQAAKNLADAEREASTPLLFDALGAAA